MPASRLSTVVLIILVSVAQTGELVQGPNTWVKRSPLKDGPPSPGMGYEASLAYDPKNKVVIRWAGHNQGGGGEQNAETWIYDPATAKWMLKEPNLSPPGVCCAQQNVFDEDRGRFLRFAGFSGNHGWQWFREIYLNNSPVWNYDLTQNTWRDQRALPAPRMASLRCASWDSDHQVVVVFGGEGSNEGTLVYDSYTNAWTRMQPPKQPAPRSAGNMAYDSARKLHILFGSQFSDDPHTWAYDLRKNEWRDMKPAVQPPTNQNDAVLAYDVHNQVVIASIRVIDKMSGKEIADGHYETWAYDAGDNKWTKMNPPAEPPGWGNRRRIMVYVPDQNVVLMENYINASQRVPGVEREQQIWTYRYAEPPADSRPAPPTDVRLTISEKGPVLAWKPSPSSEVTGYRIVRGLGPQPWRAEFQQAASVSRDTTSFLDDKTRPHTIYYYKVQALGKHGDSAFTKLARTQPRTVEDLCVSVESPTQVRLLWTRPPKGDIAGYHVERAVVEVFSEDQVLRLKKDTPPLAEPSVGAVKAIGPFARLTKKLIETDGFTDDTLDLSRPLHVNDKPVYEHRFRPDQLDANGTPYRFGVYAYRVIAVNKLGVESGAGPFALTILSSPQWLFSKEDGGQCHLKWSANPEEKLQGYRIYRMESPRINGPGQKVTRLTAEPVTQPRFTDEQAGKVTRRYWVVAVDKLGQEGFPSAPTWHLREYRRFYVPFVGEWHQ